MRLLLLSALLVAPAYAASAPSPAADMPVIKPGPSATTETKDCPPTSRYHAAKREGKLSPRNLDELPMADAYAAVYRHIGHCEAPIIVRYGIGGIDDTAERPRR